MQEGGQTHDTQQEDRQTDRQTLQEDIAMTILFSSSLLLFSPACHMDEQKGRKE